MKPLPINEKLVWDYDIPDDAQENEAFLRWYVTRVLSRGGDADLRAIGFQTIHDYLPELNLPREIRESGTGTSARLTSENVMEIYTAIRRQ